jgi:hypothetical protein
VHGLSNQQSSKKSTPGAGFNEAASAAGFARTGNSMNPLARIPRASSMASASSSPDEIFCSHSTMDAALT